VNIEPYLPAITALFTLVNTLVLAWNHRQVRKLRSRVNGMYLQTLADAEFRGRAQAKGRPEVLLDVPDATSARARNEPQG
jgi:hypothetical protein